MLVKVLIFFIVDWSELSWKREIEEEERKLKEVEKKLQRKIKVQPIA